MRQVFVVLLLSSLTFAQTASKAQATAPLQTPAASAAEKTAELAPSAAVITVAGFCPGKQARGADCNTEVSRAEFEKLVKALNPAMPEPTKRQLANAYARMIVMAKLAEERGIAKKPEVQEVLRFTEMQTLSQLFVRELQEEAAKIPPAEVDKYYNDHAGQYTQATLQRVFIPKMPPNAQEKVDEAAVKAEGAKIVAAAKAPDADFGKLQKQAYEDLKITATPPPTDLKDVRRDNIPPGQAKAFDLKAGEVSEAIEEPGGIYIYRVVSKKTLTQPEVEQDIKKVIEQERMQSTLEKLTGNIKPELNETYFGGPAGERPQPPQLLPPQTVTPKPAPAPKAPAAAPKSSTAPKTPK